MAVLYGLRNDYETRLSDLGVVSDSLRLYYDAGIKSSYSGSGPIWYDLSGYNTHCTLYGSGGSTYTDNVATEPELENFKQPPSFKFDGENDWGKFSNFASTTNFTVSVWIKTTDSGTNGLLSHCSGGPVGEAWSVAGGFPIHKYYSGAWLSYTGSTSVNDGSWKNIVWAHSGTNLVLYIDGVQDATTTLSAVVNSSLACIASEWGPCNPDSYGAGTSSYSTVFNGNIGAIMCHTKQLNSTEVLQNYTALKTRYRA